MEKNKMGYKGSRSFGRLLRFTFNQARKSREGNQSRELDHDTTTDKSAA
jgi:hypothetical protein